MMKLMASMGFVLLAFAASAYGNPRVQIDGRDVLLDGENYVPHGMVHAGSEHLSDLAGLGINSLHIDVPFNKFDPLKSDEENRKAFEPWVKRADAAHAKGMTVLWLFSFHYTPDWLWERYPDVRMKKYDGSDGAGGWIKMCLNHPGFRADAQKWLTFIAELLGPHPATVGYVLWNEPHLTSEVDYHPYTVAAFHRWLEQEHEDIAALNKLWGTAYETYTDIKPPAPRGDTYWDEVYDRMAAGGAAATSVESTDQSGATNPALWMAWMRFRQVNFAAFWEWEAGVLRAADSTALITSKIVPFDLYTSHAHGAAINTELWARTFLDVVGMDLYSHLDESFLARWKCDYFRSMSQGKPIWNTESNFTFTEQRGLATPEQWRTAFYYQFARGVNGFWNYHWADNDSHSLSYKGHRESPVTQELARLSAQAAKLAPLMKSLRPAAAQVAVLHSTATGLALGGDYAPTADLTTMVKLLYRNQTPFDFVSEAMIRAGALSRYRVLIVVGTVAIADDLVDAIGRFVDANGGHVFANARFGELDGHGRKREVHPPPWMGLQATRFYRKPSRKIAVTLELKRTARSFEDQPIEVHVERAVYMAKSIQIIDDETTTGSGTIYGSDDTQLPWSSGGRHDMYWERIMPMAGGRITGQFANMDAAIIATRQTIYIARDLAWVDQRFEQLFQDWLRDSGVYSLNQALKKGTTEPEPSVDVRMWENEQRRLLFVTNSAPTLSYDGKDVYLDVTFESYGEVTDALTGEKVRSTWHGFKRIIRMTLKAGEVRVLLGKPYPGGWKGAQAKHGEVMEHFKPDPKAVAKPHNLWWKERGTGVRAPSEVWVYDARTELGMGMHGLSDEHAKMVRKLGVRLVRKTVYWYEIEKTEEPGLYDEEGLAKYDRIVQTAKDNGIELMLLLHGNVPGTGWDRREESYERFAQFAGFMAKRYPSVRLWELWNEMDVGFTDLFGAKRPGYAMFERGRCYGQMLKQAYPAIKAANADAWVLVGGISSGSAGEFIAGIYTEGARDYFDFMNIHTYGVPVSWPMAAGAYAAKIAMERFGDFDRPLWNTEFGIDAGNLWSAWQVDTGEKFDEGHLSAWKSCIAESSATGLYAKILPYQFAANNERANDVLKKPDAPVTLPEGHTIDDYGFGLLRRDGKTPRPTYDWLLEAQVNHSIEATPTSGDVVFDWDGSWKPVDYEFEVGEGTITVKNLTLDSMVPTILLTNQYYPPKTKAEAMEAMKAMGGMPQLDIESLLIDPDPIAADAKAPIDWFRIVGTVVIVGIVLATLGGMVLRRRRA